MSSHDGGHVLYFFFSSRRRHTRFDCDWSSDVCSSDLFSIRTRAPVQIPDQRAFLQCRARTASDASRVGLEPNNPDKQIDENSVHHGTVSVSAPAWGSTDTVLSNPAPGTKARDHAALVCRGT